jgi:hypothetical protein
VRNRYEANNQLGISKISAPVDVWQQTITSKVGASSRIGLYNSFKIVKKILTYFRIMLKLGESSLSIDRGYGK